jgi:hypothetical protein
MAALADQRSLKMIIIELIRVNVVGGKIVVLSLVFLMSLKNLVGLGMLLDR